MSETDKYIHISIDVARDKDKDVSDTNYDITGLDSGTVFELGDILSHVVEFNPELSIIMLIAVSKYLYSMDLLSETGYAFVIECLSSGYEVDYTEVLQVLLEGYDT